MPRLSILFLGLLGLGSQLSAAQLVGKLPGDVTVTNTGSAVYTMPISMPPGIAGMAPELGIAYDSSSGNGLLGMGFSLYGLSAITRTPTTLEQDEITDGIDFDMYDPQDPTAQGYDRFALDGQRLVCVSGDYGFAGSEYRTEIDSFARVTAVGSSNKGPDYFIVETKSGLKKTYGQTNSASLVYNKFLHPDYGTKVTWLLNKIEDTNGNVINYNYASSIYSEMKYISEISYGSPGHLLKAVMEYGSRDDDIPSYLHGVDFKTTRRLEMIRIYSGSTELYNYTLTYDTSPQRPFSRLREIKYTDVATGDWME
ncbi:MAG: SpvB/TcaC N-terminal domain-containing protein, partial [Opitutales bacterium]